MQKDALVQLFEHMQVWSGTFVHAGVEFWMLVGRIHGMLASGVDQLEGFQGWVAQELCGSPVNSVWWEAIIADSVAGHQQHWHLTDKESLEAYHKTLSLLIGYCQTLEETPESDTLSD